MGDVVERTLMHVWKLNAGPLVTDLPLLGDLPKQQPSQRASVAVGTEGVSKPVPAGAGGVSKPERKQDSPHRSPSLGVLQQVPSLFSTWRSLVIIFFVSILCSMVIVAWARPNVLAFTSPERKER